MKKVFVLQNIIPNYREEVFRLLAGNVDLTVFYSQLSKVDKSKSFVQKDKFEGFKYELVHSINWRGRVYQFSVLKRLIFQKPDVFIAQNLGQFDMLVALTLCKLLGINFYWWHGGTPHIDGSEETRGIVKLILGKRDPREYVSKFSDGIFVYSEHAKAFFERKGFRNCIVASNSPDTNKFISLKEQQRRNPDILSELRKRFSPNDEKVILLLGRLDSTRRTDDLIHAYAEIIRDRGSGFSLVIIGDGSERKICEAMCFDLNLPNVHFEGAIYDDDSLASYFGVADFFVTPGVASMAIKIAMTFGVPVITADYGLEVHIIKHAFNGYVYPIGEYFFIRETVLYLTSHTEKYRFISENAELTISTTANINKMIEGFLKGIYLE